MIDQFYVVQIKTELLGPSYIFHPALPALFTYVSIWLNFSPINREKGRIERAVHQVNASTGPGLER